LQEFQKPSLKPDFDEDSLVDTLCRIEVEDVSPVGAMGEYVALSGKLSAPQRLDYGPIDRPSHDVHRIRQYVVHLHVVPPTDPAKPGSGLATANPARDAARAKFYTLSKPVSTSTKVLAATGFRVEPPPAYRFFGRGRAERRL
jgi:hypothetical protein